MAHTKNIKITKLPHSIVEIEGEIPAEVLLTHRKEALADLSKNVKLDGFRQGHIPETVLVSKLGEVTILEEAAEIALQHEYVSIVDEHKLEVIGKPEVILTKIAPGSDAGFKIKATVIPEIVMGDYKKIANKEMKKKEDKIEVTEKDIDDVIEEVRKLHMKHGNGDPIRTNSDKSPTSNGAGHEEDHSKHEHILPEFNDEFVKKLGEFENVADFRAKAKKNLEEERKQKAKDKRRTQIIDAILESTKIDLPEILVKSELDRMKARFEDELAHAGLSFPDYLKHIKKTEEEIAKEWRPSAENHAKTELILSEIARKEKIIPTKEEVDAESKALMEHYQHVEPERVRAYVTMLLMNEKVIAFLEDEGGK
ncbi:MAG: trigger factor [Candidatus Pacebacteria bacterium]|nr:trigger factor [Candidatus Paceibacterota bacterium]MDD5356776.1 trigger factor [Candidatus Paceibacterota bacterium]